jgi:site-specific DNA-methyltransferase (adenine-specific)
MPDMSPQKLLGQYPTPVWVAEALVERHFSNLDQSDCVYEPSCGPGAFLAAIPRKIPAFGVEIDAAIAEEARRNTGRPVITGDFRTVTLDCQPTAIIGNPPFNLKLVDGFLDRAHSLLPEGGRVGFILPTFAFQTASRVSRYSDQWSLAQEMLPRNIYPGLSKPLVFAIFSKDRKRTLVGFALYRETADIQQLPKAYREPMSASSGPVWRNVVDLALNKLGGEADLQSIYAEIEGTRPTKTAFWREQIRKTLRAYGEWFESVAPGRYRRLAAA